MLENILSEMNENLKIIANSIKEKEEIKNTTPTMPIGQAANNVVPQPVPMPNTVVQTTTPQPVQQASNIPQPIPMTVPIQQVPMQSANERNFTKEELARAMSDAVSTGKMNTIMRILGQFNVQTFAEINPDDYNRLASMLVEEGIKI